MGTKKKLLIWLGVFIVLMASSTLAYQLLTKKQSAPSPNAAPSASQKISAPDFTVEDTNGNKVSLSDIKGKPIVLNFWASWCGPCQSEMPDYEKMFEEYAPQGVVFMFINLTDGTRETPESAKQFIKEKGYSFPIYFDTKLTASNTYGISSIPDSIFIDKNGYVTAAYRGVIDEASMKYNLEALLH